MLIVQVNSQKIWLKTFFVHFHSQLQEKHAKKQGKKHFLCKLD